MRYISLVFILFLLGWSWSEFKTSPLVSEDTHIGIQEDFKRVVTEYLVENLASVKNIQFERFWTQTLKADQVKATFSYSFDDLGSPTGSEARIGIEGFAILNRQKDENNEFDLWTLDEIYVSNNIVTFKDGTLVRPSESSKSIAEPSDKQ